MKHKDPKFSEELGKRVEQRMQYLNIDKNRLSEVSGLSRKEISDIVRGKVNPQATTITKLAFGLAMTTDELINFKV